MIKSRRKLKARKVAGKVYDPMPRGPKCAPRARATTGVRDERTYNVIALNASNRKVRTFKSGKRRIIF
jgi:hypothetical protein